MSKSKKMAIIGISFSAITAFFQIILTIIKIIRLNIVLKESDASSITKVPQVITILSIIIWLLLFVVYVNAIIFSILAAIKSNNQTYMIITLVGIFTLIVLAIIGLGLIIKENKDKCKSTCLLEQTDKQPNLTTKTNEFIDQPIVDANEQKEISDDNPANL
ncbi:hypothetical protein [[Mycoplasma] anseris]|uniref:Uncharacterized protein n=1 Tax=[Mycoplasma] anseris TaxID=92400 RepID=A0A2Z4NCB1_9BACT|nr:hypothetical protein [[Mycoplasma] anseris]AWX69179.1 hypothetical protein DP065_00125 [[Mycoplasma] anseris]